jgi:predicted regulator of Ras-like GTPase activity (Roadblock/LC7/MglB family)
MEALGTLSRLRGVRGALVASERDGLAVESVSQVAVDVEALAAFATSLYRRARQTAGAAGFGEALLVSLDAADGRVVAAARGDLIVIAMAERDTHPGLLRVALLKALAALA